MTRLTSIAVVTMGFLLATTAPAAAQITLGPISGALTGHIGTATGSDGEGTTPSIGGSVAVVEQSGWGAEFDAGFANDDDGRTGGLDLQSYVLNVIGVWPKGRLRPFGTVGGGALRARTCPAASCAEATAWTDWAYSAGGGLVYLVNETFGLRGEVRYFSTIGDHPDPARAGGLHFWRVAVGATFLWVAD